MDDFGAPTGFKMDDFGAPSGQIKISLKFHQLFIKNERFRSSQWPDPNFIRI